MRRLVSTIIGSQVVAEGGEPLGKATDVWIDRRTGVLKAVRVQKGMVFPHEHFARIDAVRAWEPNITVADTEALIERAELEKVESAAQRWIGLPVRQVNGTALGSVTDLELETDLSAVQRIHIERLMGPSRIVEASYIYEVTEGAVILLDEVERRAQPRGVVQRLFQPKQSSSPDTVPNV